MCEALIQGNVCVSVRVRETLTLRREQLGSVNMLSPVSQ